jgi:hypothetical protein
VTLTVRNRYLLAGIAVSLVALSAVLLLAYRCLPYFPGLAAEAASRPPALPLLAKLPANPYAPFCVIAVSAIYAVIAQILVYHSFEKTQSPEILFFALFIFSFTFVSGRLLLPLEEIYDLPRAFVAAAERLEQFGRIFGMFSLFVSSVYAAGLKAQRQGTVLFSVTIAALLIALRIPIDSLSWDTNFRLASGYRRMFSVLEMIMITLTVAGFLVSAHTRGAKEFFFAGIGVLCTALGRVFLLDADAVLPLFPAAVSLGAGTWLVSRQLRRIYLWM